MAERILSILIVAAYILLPGKAFADVAADTLPVNPVVMAGTASCSTEDNTLTVNQASDRAVIKYDSFSIGSDATVQFNQPATTSITLNRVKYAVPSEIMGQLKATGRIFLVNPYGIIFGQGCKVDTMGLIASTLKIDDCDFMDGNDTFYFYRDKIAGMVRNSGAIQAGVGGFVGLLGPQIENTSTGIISLVNSVVLASGDAMTVSLDPAGIINVVIHQEAGVKMLIPTGIINAGTISAGSSVLLTAQVLDTLFDNAINNSGIIEAQQIRFVGNGSILLESGSQVSAENLGGDASVCIESTEGDISFMGSSTVSAVSNDIASVIALAAGILDAPAAISADGKEGNGIVALFAGSDLFAGDVAAMGADDVVPYLEGLVNEFFADICGGTTVHFSPQFSYGNAILLGSLDGDITLGDLNADAVIAAALGGPFCPPDEVTVSSFGDGMSGGSIYHGTNDVGAHLFLALAAADIGTATAPIQTDVDILAAYSFDTGDIFINEANGLEVGVNLPFLVHDSAAADTEAFVSMAVAANDGTVNIRSVGDMLVNAILAPRGGVFLETLNGSLFAGKGWPAGIDQETIATLGDNASSLIESYLGWSICPEYIFSVLSCALMDVQETPYGESTDYFSPFMIFPYMRDEGTVQEKGPNVLAGGFSYFSAPEGTIGIGDPRNGSAAVDAYNPLLVSIQALYDNPAVPEGFVPEAGLTVSVGGVVPSLYTDGSLNPALGVSGAFTGIVRPGVEAVTGVYPSPAIDLAVPPLGYVFYDDSDEFCYGPAGDFASLPPTNAVAAVDYLVANQIWPAFQSPNPDGLLVNALMHNFRAYYELMDEYRFVSNEPATPTNFFAYHPLRDADMSAFDEIMLDEGAYDFISDDIKLKKRPPVYFE